MAFWYSSCALAVISPPAALDEPAAAVAPAPATVVTVDVTALAAPPIAPAVVPTALPAVLTMPVTLLKANTELMTTMAAAVFLPSKHQHQRRYLVMVPTFCQKTLL